MATKSSKAKKSRGKVRDLTARKDPRGGAQKKERSNLNLDANQRSSSSLGSRKRNLN